MLEVDIGKYGAKRQTLRGANPRDILQNLIQTSPSKSEDEIMEDCWHKVRAHSGMMRTIFNYWFANNFRSLIVHVPTLHPLAQKVAQQKVVEKQITQKLKAEIKQKVFVRLLELQMPSGKTLAAAKREELTAMGGWALRVADRLQPGQTVAEAGLTETDLQTLYQG